MIRLFDTATGRLEPLEPLDSSEVSIYVCGPTVSGDYHVGHGRFTVVWDTLRRYLTWSGLAVRLVSNITDVDDKIIARAQAEGIDACACAAVYEAQWWSLMDRLGVLRPDAIPRATDYVAQMIAVVERLIRAGAAYRTDDGVYFATRTEPGRRLLTGQVAHDLVAGARLDLDQQTAKRSPADFVLWKPAKPNEPSWPAPFGRGRPGWHTECVAMALDLLGSDFDLHGGGSDLAFPHHENERAQAEALGHGFARHWVHSGMVVTEGGDKMSKSLGNGVGLAELLELVDPRAFRMLVLQAHYRSPLTLSAATLEAAKRTLSGLDAFAEQFVRARTAEPAGDVLARFRERMDEDLDTPRALGTLFGAVKAARNAEARAAARIAAAVFAGFEQAFGLPLGHAEADAPEPVRALLAQRDAAREGRDFARADALRAEIAAAGYVVEDSAAGSTLRLAHA